MEDKLNVLAPEVVKVDEIDKNNLKVVLEPFERGFGYTVGPVSYTHLRAPRDQRGSRMPSSA